MCRGYKINTYKRNAHSVKKRPSYVTIEALNRMSLFKLIALCESLDMHVTIKSGEVVHYFIP